METRAEIAKYLAAASRSAAIGMSAEQAVAIAGGASLEHYETGERFLANAPSGLDMIVAKAEFLSPELLAGAASRLSEKGVVVVACDVDAGSRILDNRAVRPLVRALAGSGFSILAPPRWLDRSDQPSLLVVARHDGFTIRDYAPGDEGQILDLFERSFHRKRDVEHWRWEYERNPTGAHAISLAFDRERSLVAQYAGYPVRLWSDDPAVNGLPANQIGDTMTALSVRQVGRGNTSLVVRTAKHFFASHCAGAVAFNYGFNTANIRRISSSYNESEAVEAVPYRYCSSDALLAGLPQSRLETLLRRWTVETAARAGEEWDRFFAEVAPSYRFLVRRDAPHVKWRYFDSPDWHYEVVTLRSAGKLVGWSVFRRIGDVLVWGDALFAPRHARGAGLVLRHALSTAVGLGASNIVAWFPPRPAWWGAVLDGMGMTISREPNDLAFMCTPFLLSDAAERLRHDFYYAACDSDLY